MTAKISKDLLRCIEDMRRIVSSGHLTLDAQVRAYDLLDALLAIKEDGDVGGTSAGAGTGVSAGAGTGVSAGETAASHFRWLKETFCTEYAVASDLLDKAYDEDSLKKETEERLLPYRQAVADAQDRSVRAVELHQCAKETYEIWQNAGFFSRYRALRRLRSLAGFRLESHRLGNYVAKTFDLMNEAAANYARSQQCLYAADVSYKIKPGIYSALNECLPGFGLIFD